MKSPAPSRPQKMALIPACIFLCFAALSVQAEETPVTPQPPDILLGPLFNDVQNAKLFPDQKTFADAVPNSDPLMILADYRMQQNQSGFDLRHFVNVNFTLPKEGEKYVPPEGQSLREHIDGLWPVLTRSTENTEIMGFSVTAAGTLCRAGRTFSRGILLGQLLHHVRTCRKRSLG